MASRKDSSNRCDLSFLFPSPKGRGVRGEVPIALLSGADWTPKKMHSVDFYFDFSSTNSYFAAFMLPEICDRNDARVNWMPAHFAALFRGTGFDTMAMTPRKARYLWRSRALCGPDGAALQKAQPFSNQDVVGTARSSRCRPNGQSRRRRRVPRAGPAHDLAGNHARILGARRRYHQSRGARVDRLERWLRRRASDRSRRRKA